MDELEVIQSLGVATSPEVFVITGKNHISTIRQLSSFEKIDEIKIVSIKFEGNLVRRLYMRNDLYKNIFKNQR